MMKLGVKTILAAALLSMCGAGTAALAGAPLSPKVAPEARQFSKEVGALVNETQTIMQANEYSRAITNSREILRVHKLTPYESATVYQMLGAVLYETDDYKGAIEAFESAIGSGGLLPKEVSNLRVNIAQLLIASNKYADGAQMLEDWIEDEGRVPMKMEEMLWQAWSQAEQYDRALPWAEKWFEAANPKERKHFDLMNFLYTNLGMADKRAEILEQMANIWPDDAAIIKAIAEY